MYFECIVKVECIGQIYCVLVGGVLIGFCISVGCMIFVIDCMVNLGVMLIVMLVCIDDGDGVQVCVLSCDMGVICLQGMECLLFGVLMICV